MVVMSLGLVLQLQMSPLQLLTRRSQTLLLCC
jgi:hypothetical protein